MGPVHTTGPTVRRCPVRERGSLVAIHERVALREALP